MTAHELLENTLQRLADEHGIVVRRLAVDWASQVGGAHTPYKLDIDAEIVHAVKPNAGGR